MGGTVDNSQPETITQFAHAHEDELWCQGENIEVSDWDGSAVGVSGGKTAKRLRGEAFGRGRPEEVSKPPRQESPRKELVGSCEVGNLGKVSPPGVVAVQEEISREGRERKATKADDAEVPKYLWHEHLFEDCGRSWTDSQKKALPRAAQVLQKGMLKHWKRKVLMSFFTWLKVKHKSLAPLDKRYFERQDGRWGLVEVKESDSPKERRTRGLAGYREWWKARATTCTRDLATGTEAIERALRASWWNWEDGSRLCWAKPGYMKYMRIRTFHDNENSKGE
jgi:hypothetical protein